MVYLLFYFATHIASFMHRTLQGIMRLANDVTTWYSRVHREEHISDETKHIIAAYFTHRK